MNAHNLAVFTHLLHWLQAGDACWLCTVTETWGSSPRPQGSLMAVSARGEQTGSLSGGCIEEDLIARLLAGDIPVPQHILYGATTEEAERLQLPCGGVVGVMVEPLLSGLALQAHLQAIVEALQQRQCITRCCDFMADEYHLFANTLMPFSFTHTEGMPQLLQQGLGPQHRLFIIGASDVAQAVAELAQWMDYAVIVCDPRAEKLQHWPVKNCMLLNMLPDEGLLGFAEDSGLAIVALTHDPRIDDMGLLTAFATRACYIGAMGSQKTSAKRRQRLQDLGISNDQLQKLHAPVGVDIGSKTPREIALAIMAELTSVNYKNKQ